MPAERKHAKPVPPSFRLYPDASRTDFILAMDQPYMQQIASGLKTYEFRRYLIPREVKRVWFYVTSPEKRISHICEIDEARTRNPGDEPLPLDGLGNREYNERHADWNGYDYAYQIKSVYELREPLTLARMKEQFGRKGAPRGREYVKLAMMDAVPLEEQIKILPMATSSEG